MPIGRRAWRDVPRHSMWGEKRSSTQAARRRDAYGPPAPSDGAPSVGIHDQHELPVEFGEVEPRCNYSWGLAGLDTGKVVSADLEFHGRFRSHIEVAARAGLVAPNYVTGNRLFIFDHSLVSTRDLSPYQTRTWRAAGRVSAVRGSLPRPIPTGVTGSAISTRSEPQSRRSSGGLPGRASASRPRRPPT
jgi:hypothetical protein